MATSKPVPNAKSPKRINLGPATGWLPAIIAFLCLALFAIAVLILFDVNAEPEDPESATVTAVSAQGYAGLRRLLEAQGHTTVLNRMEDNDEVTRADLEIITLSDPFGVSTFSYGGPRDSSADGSASSADDPEQIADDPAPQASVSTSDGEGVQTSGQAASGDEEEEDDDDSSAFQMPQIRRATHILASPLGRVVLVVAPKWIAASYPLHARWAQDPQVMDRGELNNMLAVLAPVTEKPTTKAEPKTTPGASSDPNVGIHVGDATTTTYDKVPYLITRAVKPQNVTVRDADGQGLLPAAIDAGRIDSLQSISGPNLVPVLMGPNGEVLLSRVTVTGGRVQPRVPVYLLSDPDLLNNQILADPKKVIAALGLVDRIAPAGNKPYSVVFNLTFNGESLDHDLLHALSRPPYLGIPLSLLVLGLGLMWAAFARFGPAREVPVEAPLGRGVKILADNAARLMAMTLKEIKLGNTYAQLMRDIVLKERGYLQIQPNTSPDDLAERIGRSHGTTDSYLDLRDRAARVVTVHQLIDVTLRLHAWKTEIQRAHI